MSTRTLDVIVKGNAGQGAAALKGFGREAQQVQQQVAVMSSTVASHTTTSANRMVKSTSKLVKATAGLTGLSKGAAKGVAGVGASYLAASASANALASATSFIPGPIGLAAGAAVAGALAIWKLHDSESAAEVQARRLAASLAAVGKAEADTERLVLAGAQAQVDWVASARAAPGLQAHLLAMQRAYNNAVREFGPNSAQATQRLGEWKQAQLEAARNADTFKRAQHDVVASTKDAGSAFEKQIKTLRERESTIRDNILAGRTFGVGAGEIAKNERALAQVQDQIAGKSRVAAAAHAAAGRKLMDLAAVARGSASPAVRDTAKALERLARQQFSAAGITQGLDLIAGRADIARSRIQAVIDAAARGVTLRLPVTGGQGNRGGSGGEGLANQELDRSGPRIVVRNRPAGTISDRATSALQDLARDDTVQDSRARNSGEAFARSAGVSNPEAIRLQGERAVLVRRQGEAKKRAGIVKNALRRVRSALAIQLKQRAAMYASLRKIPAKNKKDREKLLTAIGKKNDVIDGLYGQERGLMDEEADIRAEANELGFEIQQTDVEIASTPTTGDGTTGTGAGGSDGVGGVSAAEAAVALADLTPGTADDISTRQALLAEEQAKLEAAKASGDNTAIVSLAGSIKALMDEIARLTGAVNENTDAQQQAAGGSVAFSFRGQSHYLGMGRGQSSDSLLDVGVGV